MPWGDISSTVKQMVYCEQLPQMKQHCWFNQFILINDNQTSNQLSIYVKPEHIKLRETEQRIKTGRENECWREMVLAWVEHVGWRKCNT